MSAYVLLFKELEDENVVIYRFGPNEEKTGRIEFNKKTRMFNELESIPAIPESTANHYFTYAAKRLTSIIKKGESFPDETFFA
ncbi:hypothetical protein ACIFQM_22550 [Paenibacillus sp. NRS-1782]|uniref:hypothetical protein n=1 Tax=unclassified Paenibacillus TaxID=185978 RepID=UPI003D2E0B73